MTEEIDILDLAKKKGWNDEQLVNFMVEELGCSKGEAWLNVELARGTSQGDVVIEGE